MLVEFVAAAIGETSVQSAASGLSRLLANKTLAARLERLLGDACELTVRAMVQEGSVDSAQEGWASDYLRELLLDSSVYPQVGLHVGDTFTRLVEATTRQLTAAESQMYEGAVEEALGAPPSRISRLLAAEFVDAIRRQALTRDGAGLFPLATQLNFDLIAAGPADSLEALRVEVAALRLESRRDLDGLDLGGIDLVGADLRGRSMCRINLAFASLDGANLRGVDLTLADLRGASLRGADLRQCRLSGALLDRADMTNADLRRARAGRFRLHPAVGAGGVVLSTIYDQVVDDDTAWGSLPRARSLRTVMRIVSASGTSFRGCDLSYARMVGMFDRADFRDAELELSWLMEIDYDGEVHRVSPQRSADAGA